ncbi:DNA polymerase III subunit chi [Aquibaculum sediminis]|uniref:DNA polymerase III subunit chi n=1 Tax=Aquibaculum sediminis TaxID=3231907 RepID=UPI0034563475
MTEVRFYHLTTTGLDRALPQLLEKTLERGKRAVVMARSVERVEWLCGLLWTYDDRGFLPHGSARDGHAEAQPVWITETDENPNGAAYLFLTDGATSAQIDDYELCALLFDGGDQGALTAARAQWKELKAAGHSISYWQQDARGRWSKQQG